MQCPACGSEMTETTIADITLDICKDGCGGIWFDNFELNKVDEPFEHADEVLALVESAPNPVPVTDQKRPCPKCDSLKMMRHFHSVKMQVEVDECPGCAGIFLDCGELRRLRSQFASEAEREQAAHAYFDDVFGEQLAGMQAESEEKLAKARRFAKMFRFICPSNYIPGDQAGGAF